MAYYQSEEHLTLDDRGIYGPREPGTKVDYSGIYRCDGCHVEILRSAGGLLPRPNPEGHPFGREHWKLIVSLQQPGDRENRHASSFTDRDELFNVLADFITQHWPEGMNLGRSPIPPDPFPPLDEFLGQLEGLIKQHRPTGK
jgi:hypothetical protein